LKKNRIVNEGQQKTSSLLLKESHYNLNGSLFFDDIKKVKTKSKSKNERELTIPEFERFDN